MSAAKPVGSRRDKGRCQIIGAISDPQKRRISLGLKQTLANPWESFADEHPIGTELEDEVRNITEFGLFAGLPGEIDGMVHLSDIDLSALLVNLGLKPRLGTTVRVPVFEPRATHGQRKFEPKSSRPASEPAMTGIAAATEDVDGRVEPGRARREDEC